MSGELEAAGAAATAGLVAHAIEGRTGTRHGDGKCLNCGAQLNGKYCSACGQPAHVHRTLAHVLEEFLHGVIHFDAKAWRTLPLLIFRPGTLTHGYIHGMRARFISPLAMFLFTIFLMFFVFTMVTPQNFFKIQTTFDYSDLTREQLNAQLADARADEARVAIEATPATVGGEKGVAAARRMVERRRIAIEQEIARRDGTAAPAPPEGTMESDANELVAAAAEEGDISFFGNPELSAKLSEKLKNPDLFIYKIQQNAYKFSFLLVPISLPFVALLFLWKRGWTLYDHVVFTLYSQSFMWLLFITLSLLSLSPYTSWSIPWLALTAIPGHMYFHLKGTYALGWWSAFWRTCFLLVFAAVCVIIFVILMFVLGALG